MRLFRSSLLDVRGVMLGMEPVGLTRVKLIAIRDYER
jgi:hypothetical protein